MNILFNEVGNDWAIVAEINDVPSEIITELVSTLNAALSTAGYYNAVTIVE